MSHQDHKIILVTGGVRSGKSRYAQELVSKYNKQVRYIATAEAKDEEMENRVQLHRENRSDSWLVVEEPIHIEKLFNMNEDTFDSEEYVTLVDCITLWTSNLLLQKDEEGKELWEIENGIKVFEEKVDSFISALKLYNKLVVIVTNEVGWGGIQMSSLGRLYQDLLGWTNQKIAAVADDVYMVVSGIPLKVKGSKEI